MTEFSWPRFWARVVVEGVLAALGMGVGMWLSDARWREWAIKRDVAEYDSTTGTWQEKFPGRFPEGAKVDLPPVAAPRADPVPMQFAPLRSSRGLQFY